MGRVIDKESVISHKKNAIKKLNQTLELFINRNDGKGLKKADLISYWLEEYSHYLVAEETYDYKRVLHYKRGDVVQLNFGFNIGSEHGGLHYAIVLDNNNLQSSPVVTVIPLSSGTEEETYNRDVYLGNELYERLNNKYNKLNEQILKELEESKQLDTIIEYARLNPNERTPDDISEILKNLSERKTKLQDELDRLKKYKKEVDKLKNGSIALMEQITTVSKMRIYKPQNTNDLLYDVTFSDGALDKITAQLKELYIFPIDKKN